MNETIKNSADTSHIIISVSLGHGISLVYLWERERGGVNKIDDLIIDQLRAFTVTSQYEYNQQDYKSLE